MIDMRFKTRIGRGETPVPRRNGLATPNGGSGARAAQTLEPKPAGASQTYAAPASARRYVAIRAVDEQGNVGRPISVELGRASSDGDDGGGNRPAAGEGDRRADRGERVPTEGAGGAGGDGASGGGSLAFTGLGLAALLAVAGELLAAGTAVGRRRTAPGEG